MEDKDRIRSLEDKTIKFVAISDTHGRHARAIIPECDVLVHAGDCTYNEGRASLREFLTWLENQPAKYKVLIAGNHDFAFEKWPDLAIAMVKEVAPSVHYLEDSGVEIEGVKFWGSPVTPAFYNWAFNREPGEDIKRHWDMIPNGIDVLITHGPAADIRDLPGPGNRVMGQKIGVGSEDLSAALMRVKPKLHLFGHIHFSYGHVTLHHETGEVTECYNCSFLGEDYRPQNLPHSIELAT